MKVVLLQDVKALGKKGDVVEVSEGYARNFLLGKKYAVEATTANLNTLKLQKANADRIAAEQLAEAQETADKLSKVTATVAIKAGENGKTFGSVSSREIAQELEKQGIIIDKKKIVLPEAIKEFGEYDIKVKLHKEVAASVKVNVVEE
ncbi:MAG: 50S ribosomal protein L9 [Lachnospiraceae bacterium]|nr:50S ribosomal protein L9 [Lachnospiraceae bacterium]